MRIIGGGRAGGALALALDALDGWRVDDVLGRDDDLAAAGDGVDLLVISTPDSSIADVAAMVAPGDAAVGHMAGSLGLDVLAPHPRRVGLHPLVPLPDAEVGARRLLGAWWAVAGDPLGVAMVEALGGRWFAVADDQRAAYHGAACIASNHLVALLGQVERLAGGAGVPLDAYLDLVRATIDNVGQLGPSAAITGPAIRGDDATLDRHRSALAALPHGEVERAAYEALVDLIALLASTATR